MYLRTRAHVVYLLMSFNCTIFVYNNFILVYCFPYNSRHLCGTLKYQCNNYFGERVKNYIRSLTEYSHWELISRCRGLTLMGWDDVATDYEARTQAYFKCLEGGQRTKRKK